jgi:glutathione synthase/RimK-type ligase-like ATP-grasp enzyme
MKIAYISYDKQVNYTAGLTQDEEAVLLDFLTAKGLDIEKVIWNDPGIDWTIYPAAILKSPWDYHEKLDEFNLWLDRLEKLNVQLMNPYHIIRWNSDKHYLQEVADAGFPVIRSRFLEKGDKTGLSVYFEELGNKKLIIKPCVSAGAKDTMILTPENVQDIQDSLLSDAQYDALIIQPFMDEVLDGEISLIFLGGQFSHSVIKVPRSGEFRVQHFFGGTIRPYAPAENILKTAVEFVDRFAKDCLYARVDGILVNGEFQLMELELIEPYLFLDTHPEGYNNYYRALQQQLS